MNLIPIGRFSEMTRLSVKALRLYDEIGLLAPAEVDSSSGYRYYHLGQANRAEAVRILRAVDMPLEEIRAVLDADNDELVHKTLVAHRERLAERLATQERMLAFLETLIQREGKIMPYDVHVTEVAPQTILAVRIRTSLTKIGQDIPSGFGALMPVMGAQSLPPAGPPLLVYHDIIDEQTDGDIEICIPVASMPEASGEVYGRELEGGAMATTVHKGPYPEIGLAYHTLMGWISEHGHEVAGPPREIYLNDPQQVPEAELLTRVEFPIH
jgi:effector-binding domain-containing protein